MALVEAIIMFSESLYLALVWFMVNRSTRIMLASTNAATSNTVKYGVPSARNDVIRFPCSRTTIVQFFNDLVG